MKLACMCLELGAWVQARVLPIKGLVAAAAGRPIWGRHREATTACFCCPSWEQDFISCLYFRET